MSSALSGSCDTAKALAAEYNGRVCVVDNKRICRHAARIGSGRADAGRKGSDRCRDLRAARSDRSNASIYLAVNTLELLKKSGRVTPAGAALATLLGLKPVLQIQGGSSTLREGARHGRRRKDDAEGAEKDLPPASRAGRCTFRRRIPATSRPRSSGARQYASTLTTTDRALQAADQHLLPRQRRRQGDRLRRIFRVTFGKNLLPKTKNSRPRS